jgi:serine/threonine-protein kinase haspin
MFASSPETAQNDPDPIANDLTSGLEKLQITEKGSNVQAPAAVAPSIFLPKNSNIQPLKRSTVEKKDVTIAQPQCDTAQALDTSEGKPLSVRVRVRAPPATKPRLKGPLPSAISLEQSTKSNPTSTDLYAAPLLSLRTDDSHRSSTPTPFSEWSESLESHFAIVKIAEASYGEVYRLVLKAAHPQFTSSDESVLKVLALRSPPDHVNHRTGRKKTKAQREKETWMSSVENVEAEIKLLQRMADIPGFTNFRDLRVLRGRPSAAFGEAWKDFNISREKGEKSQFPDPAKKTSYDEDQLWVVIEMQDAGTDLEHVRLQNVWSVWDVFWGVTLALAKGEREARFEHRDLHMGNICVRSRKADGNIGPENARIRGLKRKLGFSGLETTIIDYTLSRAEMVERDTATFAAEQDNEVAFLDLANEKTLFTADATEEYQYEIYRYMRSAVFFSDATADHDEREDEATKTGRSWAGFHPQTNLVWLHFVLHELLADIVWPSQSMEQTLKNLDPSEKEDERAAKRRSKKLEAALKQLRSLLEIDKIPADGLASVVDLIVVALEKGWLDEDDIAGEHSDVSCLHSLTPNR